MPRILEDIPNVKLQAALQYADLGWKVIPLHHVNSDGSCSCGHPECRAQGKHPRIAEWQNQCSDYPEIIERWWTNHPNANVGVVCGASGIVVVDIDLAHGGEESLEALQREIGIERLPQTVEARTGSGGRHLIFKDSGNIVRSRTGLRPGIDVRADRGQIVVAPSSNAGGTYEWIRSPFDFEIMPIPQELLRAINGHNGSQPQTLVLSEVPNRDHLVEGCRNSSLTSMGGRLRRNGADEAEISEELSKQNRKRCQPPLEDNEVQTIARSIAKYDPVSADMSTTDVANAKRFVERFDSELKYCPGRGWFHWNGRYWEQDYGSALRLSGEIGLEILVESSRSAGPEVSKQLRKHARNSQNMARIRAMIALAEVASDMAVKIEDLDADPYIFNCSNGTIDLRTGELLPHDRSDLITKISPVAYNPNATAPRFLAFLGRIMGDNQCLIEYLQLAFGYALTGDISEQVWFYCYGVGKNGKTTLLTTIMYVMGDYSAQTSPTTWLASNLVNSAAARPDLAKLPGIRLIVTSEPDQKKKLSEDLLKVFTGGDPVTCRNLYKDEFQYVPQGKICLSANYKLSVTGQDDGFWRRVRMIPFEVVIPEEERDKKLREKLVEEREGILAWLVQGAMRWAESGLSENRTVNEMTADYKIENDPLDDFLKCEELVFGDDLQIESSALYRMYVGHCEENKLKPMSRNSFGRQMTSRGFEPWQIGNNRRRCWRGIGVRGTSNSLDNMTL